jgi:hypothetical protein
MSYNGFIYKHPYGIHIDLSKIISVSEPKFLGYDSSGINVYAGYELTCQLLDKPLIISRKIRDDEKNGWFYKFVEEPTEKDRYQMVNNFADWQQYFPLSVCYQNILKEREEFIKDWKWI